MKRVYCRCNGGDYFEGGGACPVDGWSSPESLELAEAVACLTAGGQEPSIAELRRLGVSEAALARTIVIEFGSEAAAFEVMTPRGYAVSGQWKPLEQFDRRFT